ncbi:MAG TPA: DNA topoisomerase, partial [Bacteroidales bacterium]|nr:DNA topoisomerase [Bacteroidales bacterium]
IETKPGKKSPAPPFTTSTLQQEASRKLGFSVAKTMLVAQQLYESGKITYMRTDSVTLSETAIKQAKEEIENLFGAEYLQLRRFTTKSKGAQEAHEAIRPTYLKNREIAGDVSQKRLYELIWKRTIASQMSDARLEKTTVSISISTTPEILAAQGEVLLFDGFLKVYIESSDDDQNENQAGVLPPLKKADVLTLRNMTATQRFTQRPYRYSEASLVKKLEELGIGRPSTYAPTISTIQKREYVEKDDKPALERNYIQLELKNDEIGEQEKVETFGSEKGRLFPTDIGQLVNQFLTTHFPDIFDYHFTASVEKNFDEIAQGQLLWSSMIEAFYNPFHNQVKEVLAKSEKVKGERLLGKDPESGLNVYVKIGRYGAIAQKGDGDNEQKPLFAGLRKKQSIETITLEEALELFKFPRMVGQYEGKELSVAIGRFGPYVKHGTDFFSLGKNDDPTLIDENHAIEIIEEKRKKDAERVIREYSERTDVKVLKGRWGPYLTVEGNNYRIPKIQDPTVLTLEDCLSIASQSPEPKPKIKKRSPKKGGK